MFRYDRYRDVEVTVKNLRKPAIVYIVSKRQRITLRLLYAIAIPSVVCLSVTLVHPTQAVKLFGNFFHHTITQGL